MTNVYQHRQNGYQEITSGQVSQSIVIAWMGAPLGLFPSLQATRYTTLLEIVIGGWLKSGMEAVWMKGLYSPDVFSSVNHSQRFKKPLK